ncbi:MAG: hypothetical protein ACYC6L_03880 [Anaerolineae bacterium]
MRLEPALDSTDIGKTLQRLGILVTSRRKGKLAGKTPWRKPMTAGPFYMMS